MSRGAKRPCAPCSAGTISLKPIRETRVNFTGIDQPTQQDTWQELARSPGATLTWLWPAPLPNAFLWHSKIIILFLLRGKFQASTRKKLNLKAPTPTVFHKHQKGIFFSWCRQIPVPIYLLVSIWGQHRVTYSRESNTSAT